MVVIALGIEDPFHQSRVELIGHRLQAFGIFQVRFSILILPANHEAHLGGGHALDLRLIYLRWSGIAMNVNEGVGVLLQQFHRGAPGTHVSLAIVGNVAVI